MAHAEPDTPQLARALIAPIRVMPTAAQAGAAERGSSFFPTEARAGSAAAAMHPRGFAPGEPAPAPAGGNPFRATYEERMVAPPASPKDGLAKDGLKPPTKSV